MISVDEGALSARFDVTEAQNALVRITQQCSVFFAFPNGLTNGGVREGDQ